LPADGRARKIRLQVADRIKETPVFTTKPRQENCFPDSTSMQKRG